MIKCVGKCCVSLESESRPEYSVMMRGTDGKKYCIRISDVTGHLCESCGVFILDESSNARLWATLRAESEK